MLCTGDRLRIIGRRCGAAYGNAAFLLVPFGAKMTQSEIEVYTREEGLFDGLTDEEIKTKVKRKMKIISRSLVSGVEKIQKKLTEADWNKIKYFT